MQTANQHNDNETMTRMAHSLKSLTANFGATKVSDLAKSMESSYDHGDFLEANNQVGELSLMIKRLCTETK